MSEAQPAAIGVGLTSLEAPPASATATGEAVDGSVAPGNSGESGGETEPRVSGERDKTNVVRIMNRIALAL